MNLKKLLLVFALLATSIGVHAAPRPQAPLTLKDKLVFTRFKGVTASTKSPTEEVWTMNPNGTNQKSVWRVPKGYGSFGGFNNAGTQALSYNGFNLYLHDLRTRRLRRLYAHNRGWGTYIGSPSFSRDGKQVVFAAGGAPATLLTSTVHVIDLKRIPTKTNMEKFRVVASGFASSWLYEPRWSPEGRRLVVSVGKRRNNPDEFTEAWNILMMNSDGSLARRVTSNDAPLEKLRTFDKEPCFSSDGQTIAFVRRVFSREKGESNDIWFVDVEGKNERRITAYEEAAKQNARQGENAALEGAFYNRISDLFFSGNGQQIAFNQTGNKNGIYLLDIKNQEVKWVTEGRLVQWVW